MFYPFWNQIFIPDDFGNLIAAPDTQTKMYAIRQFFLPIAWTEWDWE